MFKPTPSLGSRLEARLKGWRGPAVNILRAESKFTDPIALAPPFSDLPRVEPRNGLPAERAYKMMGLPMEDILEMRGGRREIEADDVITVHRLPKSEEQDMADLQLGIAKVHQKVKRE